MSIVTMNPHIWPFILPRILPMLLAAVRESDGDWDIADLDLHILRGNLLAWVIVREGNPIAFIAGEFISYPRYVIFNVTFAAGELRNIQSELQQLYALVKAGGAKYVEAHCHTAAARLFRRYGFRPIRAVVRREL